MYPTELHALADLEHRQRLAAAQLRRRHSPHRPRPPGRLRRSLAALLLRLAERLHGEPLASPRRA